MGLFNKDDHWAAVPLNGTDGKPLSSADRERLRLEVSLTEWPEALEAGRKAKMREIDVWEMARSYRASHPSDWRERFMRKLVDRAEHPEEYAPRFTGTLLRQAEEKVRDLVAELRPEAMLAVYGELASFLEQRKADPSKAADYRLHKSFN